MTRPWQIALVVAALAAVPFVTQSNTVLNFLVFALLIALAGQGWNVLGGYGGQYSFGHAAFFGTGAYVTAILQVSYGVNAWLGFALGVAAGALPLGVDATRVKLGAMTLSAAITAAAGCFYTQYFLFLDAGIAYGPWISVEALLTAIIGGVGTILGPLLGALVVRSLGEAARLVTGDAPGLDLVIYGAVLVVVVWFAPRG